ELEHHVTGDVVFGAHEYVSITGDESFKEELVEMAIQCAKFWSTRVKWQEEKNRYEIHQVIGPDEYTEHVDNNAYTNYLASYSLRLALQLMEEFPDRAKKMITSEEYDDLIAVNQALYLPTPNERGIIPQDDTFLSKKEIDLDKYHKATQVLTILNDYNMDQINDLQVLKQADVLLLLLLFPESFSQEIKQANWDYYYPRTLHDSSLSKSTHCNFALLLNDVDTAYKLFQSIFDIDLSGENMHSSDDGIHAASLGGVWQNVVLGFGGLRINKNGLSLAPKLPRNWDRLEYVIKFKKRKMTVTITHDQVEIREDSGEDHSEIELLFFDRKEVFKDKLTLKY
ncbi:MAG: glycoside hydrolase family 65 protein, partial [Enterococcus sp.]|nr:glycoside hydrolase family 65 protein [Enterococcus sp.]